MNKYILCASLVLLNPCFAEEMHFEECELQTIDNTQKSEPSQTPRPKRQQKIRKKRFVTRDNKSANQTQKQQPAKTAPAKPIKPSPKVVQPVKPAPAKPTPKVVQPVKPAPVKPAPKVVQPVKPAPVKPTPKVVQPVKPAPAKPTPKVAQPVKPAPVKPTPKVVQPVKPAPAKPTPKVAQPVKPAPKPVLPKAPQNQVQVKKEPITPKKPEVIIGFEGLIEPEKDNLFEAENESGLPSFPIEGSRRPTRREQPLNKKETSPQYDRNINRETHHSVSENTPQNSKDQESSIQGITAQSTESNNISVEKLVVPKKCDTPFHQAHVGLRHSEARGVGYRHGYTTLEGFGIWDNNTDFMPFFDLRGHIFDHGKFAGNAGFGGRTLFSSINHLLGYYLYYDVRQENHGLTVQQLSPGVEVLGKRMEYRMNAYFPIVKNSHKYDFDFDRFDDHHIRLKAKQKQAMTGWDAEVGAHITQNTKYDAYAGAGPYYFSSSEVSAWGIKTRLLGRFKEYVSLEATYTYDHLFGSIIQGSVGVSLPLGNKIKRKDKNCASGINLALSRAAFAPYRFEIPVVKRVTRRPKAVNPATGDPWFVWFVDNTSSSDGTFESPFPTLVQAQNASGPNDMIYVFPGDGTSKGMDKGIILQKEQTLFGSGIHHRIKTTHGKVEIPAFSNNNPLITNTGGNVVTLADGNNVSGLNIFVSQANLIGIFGAFVNGATITHNHISGNTNHTGIFVGGFGRVKVKDNVCSGTPGGADTSDGIALIVADRQFMKGTIKNNNVQGYTNGIEIDPGTATAISTTDMTVKGNFVSNFSTFGIIQERGFASGSEGVKIVGNTIINNAGTGFPSIGIAMIAFNSVPALQLSPMMIVDNFVFTTTPAPASDGIVLELIGSGILSQNASISNNVVTTGTGMGSLGIVVEADQGGTICTSIDNNNIILQAASGTNSLKVFTTGNGVINIDSITGNVAPNILLTGNVNLVPEGTCE